MLKGSEQKKKKKKITEWTKKKHEGIVQLLSKDHLLGVEEEGFFYREKRHHMHRKRHRLAAVDGITVTAAVDALMLMLVLTSTRWTNSLHEIRRITVAKTTALSCCSKLANNHRKCTFSKWTIFEYTTYVANKSIIKPVQFFCWINICSYTIK